ncbi:TetR/AcrR family transcriptional regulator [Roseibium hamelinense]|uniref:TetR/AcrR family transcriptional regulator n=1 Tax=Roseibium hamelinense TaxID=150831 RepID=UPI0014793577|nr:TetR/AcrR family transcriptional regulator [Roseibium hamelinense]
MELLAQNPPEDVALSDIAAAARTSKQALYRRWPDKAALVIACIETGLASRPLPPPERSNVARDLSRLMTAAANTLTRTCTGRALFNTRRHTAYQAPARHFEDTLRFSVRQCLIASSFESHADQRADLLIGWLWLTCDAKHRAASWTLSSATDMEAEIEKVVFLVLGLAPAAPVIR